MSTCPSPASGVRSVKHVDELKQLGLDYTVISIGKKGNQYQRRPTDATVKVLKDSQSQPRRPSAPRLYSLFVAQELDKIELLYSSLQVRRP